MTKFSYEYSGAGERLDRFLSRNLKEISRAQLQKKIQTGEVTVNEKPVEKKNFLLHNADRVEFVYKAPSLRKSPKIRLKKIYENDDILIIDKPTGLAVHPTPTQNKDSVAGAVLASGLNILGVGENDFRPGIVHRLDADTSGLLVIAKNQTAYEFIKEAFKSRRVVKRYRALVHGRIAEDHGVIDKPVGRQAGQGKFKAGIGRSAKTEYWTEGYYGGGVDNYTLLRIQLHTGRTHQIRVHFSSLGHPVAGDRLYGGRFKKSDAKFFSRQFLHAYYLELPMPGGGIKKFQINLARDLTETLKKLIKNN